MVESEGELVRNAGNGNVPAITAGSGIPPRLLGYEIRSPSNLVSRSISLRRQTFPNKEIRIGLRRMVTRIHKAIKFTPHQIPLNELIELLFKAVRGRAQPAACRNAFRQPRGQHAPAGSVHVTVVSW